MSIADLITPSLITLNLEATDAEQACSELGALLVRDKAVVDLSAYLSAVFAREALGTTAVGFGVAIPHGKSSSVARAGVAFGRSERGLAWSSLDDEPVHLVFLIAAPEAAHDLHLKALAQLARLLMHDEVRNRLLAARTADEVLQALQ